MRANVLLNGQHSKLTSLDLNVSEFLSFLERKGHIRVGVTPKSGHKFVIPKRAFRKLNDEEFQLKLLAMDR